MMWGMDRVSKAKRSEIMSKIRGKNTGPERLVFKYLRDRKVYFQRHYKRAPGCPDVAVPSKKLAIFIDGGFWHGYGFASRKKKLPEFWQNKIEKNMRRDKRNRRLLKLDGWKVLRIWDHQLTSKKREKNLRRVMEFLLSW